jgi:methyl-accepting chemotaxis protein
MPRQKILSALKTGQHELAKKIYQEETVPHLNATQEALITLRNEFKDLVGAKTARLRRDQARMGIASLSIYAVILAAMISGALVYLVRPIRQGFSDITKVLQDMSKGDLMTSVEVKSDDEIGQALGNAKMVENLSVHEKIRKRFPSAIWTSSPSFHKDVLRKKHEIMVEI